MAQPSNLRSEAATQPFDFVRDSGGAHDDVEQGGFLGDFAYSAGVGGARFRRQFLDLWISFIGLPSL